MPNNYELPDLIARTIGHRSTKHVSYAESQCPIKDDSLRVGQQMTVELNQFYDEHSFLNLVSKYLEDTTIAELVSSYERSISGVIYPSHVEPEIGNNLKVNLQKNVESLLKTIEDNYPEGSIPRVVLQLIKQYSVTRSIGVYKAAKVVISYLEGNFHILQAQLNLELRSGLFIVDATRKVFSNLLNEHQSYQESYNFNQTGPIPLHISLDDKEGLVLVSKLQELPYSVETLKLAHELLSKNQVLKQTLIVYQQLLVEYSKIQLAVRSEEFSTLIPFEEIFIEHGGVYVPNVRLLKIMANNWVPAIAQAMIERGATDPDQLEASDFVIGLANVEKREKQFHLPIFMFNQTSNPNVILLNGIIHKVCPAKSVITSTGISSLPLLYEKVRKEHEEKRNVPR